MNSNKNLTFFYNFLKNPKEVGSVIPSSRFLAMKMIEAVNWDEIKTIAEFGSGTGAITKYIQKSVSSSAQVLLFEMDTNMRSDLQSTYHHFQCYENSLNLVDIMNRKGIQHMDCIMSGLPFFNFSNEVREKLLHQITTALKPGGLFVAFQYSLQMKKLLKDTFIIEKIKFTPFNIPPAFVYVCRKK